VDEINSALLKLRVTFQITTCRRVGERQRRLRERERRADRREERRRRKEEERRRKEREQGKRREGECLRDRIGEKRRRG